MRNTALAAVSIFIYMLIASTRFHTMDVPEPYDVEACIADTGDRRQCHRWDRAREREINDRYAKAFFWPVSIPWDLASYAGEKIAGSF